MWTRNERRNVLIGLGVALAILVIAAVFFSDAGEGARGAIGMLAFCSVFVVHHALDERERRRERDR